MSALSMRNCKKCGKVFTFVRSPICRDCEEIEEASFETVRVYLKENPNKNLETVSEETGVSPKKILKYIKEGRLIISQGMSGDVKCENCGKPVVKCKYCASCALKLEEKVNTMFGRNSTINSTIEKPKQKSVMYTQRDKNKK